MASATAQHDMKMAWVKVPVAFASGCDQVKGFCGCNYVALISGQVFFTNTSKRVYRYMA